MLTFSCYKIHDADHLPFLAGEYSKFKFGDGQLAYEFGSRLGAHFIKENKELLLNTNEIVVLPSPYNSIPTASYWMTARFIEVVNLFLASHKKNSLLTSRIHRYKTYSEDYGNMNYEQRVKLISTDTYYIDSEFLKDRVCLFIDDIRITGSHEYVLRNLIRSKNIRGQFIFIYFAELMNSEISPTFENILNYAYVKSIKEVTELINQASFVFNTRVIKYILITPADALDCLIRSIPANRLKELIKLAISNNYHLMPEYESNLNYLIKHSNYGN
jgi:PRTase ComF-like